MPIYEFKCSKCGAIHEVLHRFSSEPAEMSCIECGSLCERIPSHIGFFRIHHTEKLDYNDPLRVYDRQHMMKDTAVQKALSDYKEQSFEEAKQGNNS